MLRCTTYGGLSTPRVIMHCRYLTPYYGLRFTPSVCRCKLALILEQTRRRLTEIASNGYWTGTMEPRVDRAEFLATSRTSHSMNWCDLSKPIGARVRDGINKGTSCKYETYMEEISPIRTSTTRIFSAFLWRVPLLSLVDSVASTRPVVDNCANPQTRMGIFVLILNVDRRQTGETKTLQKISETQMCQCIQRPMHDICVKCSSSQYLSSVGDRHCLDKRFKELIILEYWLYCNRTIHFKCRYINSMLIRKND